MNENEKKVLEALKAVAGKDTKWSYPADVWIEWAVQHTGSESFKDFAAWVIDEGVDLDNPESWDFFFGWDVEDFAVAYLPNDDERRDFWRFWAERA